MLIERTGDMFSADTYIIGHGVNTHGVMGAGVAKIVREKFPKVYEYYREEIEAGRLTPGKMNAFLTVWPGTNYGVWVFNLATQDAPGPHARVEWIAESVRRMLQSASEMGASKITLPRLGCGIGGLGWERDVQPIFATLALAYPDTDIEVWSL